jgi:hypothetical protein
MIYRLSRYALIILAIIVMGVYIPMFYHKIFDQKLGKTQVFFSPVIKKFIFQEMVGDAHDFINKDEDGKIYDRQQFETLIPFIYYKNMELWGKLPVIIEGKTFDKETILENRQVFEVKSNEISDRRPLVQIFPLLESAPGVARLSFPEDAFRFTDKMEFINVDTNKTNGVFTSLFTNALQKAGFIFPAKLVSGTVSILKPFDEGFFVVDAANNVFHIKRLKGEPLIVKTPMPASIGARHIKIIENSRKEIYGFLITNSNEIYLIMYDNYRLVKLPLDNYQPDKMDFKLLFNPIYRTAVYWDNKKIYALAMDLQYKLIAKYEKEMFSGQKTRADIIFSALFPFSIEMKDNTMVYLKFEPVFHGWIAFIGIFLSLAIFIAIMFLKKTDMKKTWTDFLVILFTGIYGLIAVLIISHDD